MIMARAWEGARRLKDAPLKWSNWYYIGLKVAGALLLLLLIVLFLLLRQNEADEQRAALIADVLWLEQSMNFELEGTTEQVRQLAEDLGKERTKQSFFALRSQQVMKSSPGLQGLVWLDASAREIDSTPTQNVLRLGYSGLPDNPLVESQTRAIEMASKLGKSIYTDAYRSAGKMQFEVYSPIFEDRQYRGVLVSVYSFNSLLQRIVPWWFAEKYQVDILDSDGVLLASKSKVRTVPSAINYTIPFDPPGYGMELQITAYRNAGNFAPTLIKTLIITLAAAMFFSLWAMRGHIRRRLAAEQALRSETAFRKAMEDSLTVGMRARNRQGVTTYANPAFCRMVGYAASELIGAALPGPYWIPEEVEKGLAFQDTVMAGTAPQEGLEMRFKRKDGTLFDALIYEAPLIDADGKHAGWMASIVDVTARKRVEELARLQQEKLQLRSRLVSMGEMASTLAHELNQPLGAISSYNAGCLNKLASGDFVTSEIEAALVKLGVQAERAGRVIHRVHEFVRRSEPKLALCNLADVINDSIALIELSARLSRVRIVASIADGCAQSTADRLMIEQVLINLIRNGIEAMSNTTPGRRKLTIALKQGDEQIEIRVIDRGTGISPGDHDKLFAPFFSTKVEGMGMGLNICRSIIEFHHGRLWAEDNPEGGTIFAFSLPLHQP